MHDDSLPPPVSRGREEDDVGRGGVDHDVPAVPDMPGSSCKIFELFTKTISKATSGDGTLYPLDALDCVWLLLLLVLRLLPLLDALLLRLLAKSDSTDAKPRAPTRTILAGAAVGPSCCEAVDAGEVGGAEENSRRVEPSEDAIAENSKEEQQI